jgi:hypothetical protein
VGGRDVVKCLDHWTSQLLRDPLTLPHAVFDGVDAAVALPRIIVSRVDYVPKSRSRTMLQTQAILLFALDIISRTNQLISTITLPIKSSLVR